MFKNQLIRGDDYLRVMVVKPASMIYEYDDIFGEIGVLNGEHHINQDPSVPPVINHTRRIPFGKSKKLT
jgi:hypothetical protein